MPFVLDPPLALPRRGLYAFFVQAENCNPAEAWRLLADDNNDYPYGIYWITPRAITACWLRPVGGGADYADLIFEIEFCSNTQTPTRRRSWGQLKTLYR
jgi:hypothetical protein